MRIRIIITGLFLINACIANAQSFTPSLTRTEAYFYSNLVGNYLDYNDHNTILTKSEMVMMMLETNDTGAVTKIHLFAENTGDSSLYSLLHQITPDYFNNKQIIAKTKGKTIIFPIYTLKYWPASDDYMANMRTPNCPFLTEDKSATVDESYHFIQVNGITHVVAIPDIPKPPVCTEPEIRQTKKMSDQEVIYDILLNDFYENSPAYIVIRDSSVNNNTRTVNYTEIAESLRNWRAPSSFYMAAMDTTWIPTLLEADHQKSKLVIEKLPHFKPRCIALKFVPRALISKAYKNMGHWGFEKEFKTRDWVTVSSIILIKNRAIVEIERHNGGGSGHLYFLEKINGQWVVIANIKLWIA